jgi:hypothetical protein
MQVCIRRISILILLKAKLRKTEVDCVLETEQQQNKGARNRQVNKEFDTVLDPSNL